jgi:FMN phosphatase YigB (HAD superfamily)
MSRVSCYDVFDTVLTRAIGSPTTVFLLLGRRLASMSLIPCTSEAFARARVAAERRARQNGGEEVTLGEIYRELGASLELSGELAERIMRLECELEQALICEVPGVRQRIEEARNQGQRVIYVSDMYLPPDFIKRALSRHDLYDPVRDGCYVSCDHGTTKLSGGLFSRLLMEERVEPGRVTHSGNDLAADVHAARAAGIRAQPLLEGNLNRYEQTLEAHAFATEGLSSAMAGASRLARLAVAASTPLQEVIRDVAAGVAAPALAGYVLWILRRSEQLGLKRLYFVSRDGQILLAVARRLAAKLGMTIELRYLHGSRQAWHLPSISQFDLSQLDWVLEETDHMSVGSILARVCVEPDEVRSILEEAGFSRTDWRRNLTDPERQRLGDVLRQEALRGLVLRRASEKRKVLLQYLRQEGLLVDLDWAMVDLGWRGRIQNSLGTILAEESAGPPRGFYFGLTSGQEDPRGGCREAYFFDRRHGTGFNSLDPTFANLMELFCAADHGMVVGYEEQGERVGPLLQSEVNRAAVHWGLPLFQETVCQFADHLLLSSDLINPGADVRAPIADVLEGFWRTPSRAEAEAYAGFPAEDDQSGAFWKPFAQSYTWRDVARAYCYARVHRHHSISWTAGSLAMTPRPIRLAMRLAAKTGRERRALLSAIRHLAAPMGPGRRMGKHVETS